LPVDEFDASVESVYNRRQIHRRFQTDVIRINIPACCFLCSTITGPGVVWRLRFANTASVQPVSRISSESKHLTSYVGTPCLKITSPLGAFCVVMTMPVINFREVIVWLI
jgi:hypothetical protein